MTGPWQTLETVPTREGVLALRRRGDSDFLIMIGDRVLMTSSARRSEEALATLGCAAIVGRPAPRVLVGGLGMGYTLRAALDALPPRARVVVAELNRQVVEWCRGPLGPLTGGAMADPRVTVHLGDVAQLIAGTPPGGFDAILLDLYEGPHAATQRRDDPFYGRGALERSRRALAPGGVLGIWSEEPDASFAARFRAAGFDVRTHRAGRGGRCAALYIGTVLSAARSPGRTTGPERPARPAGKPRPPRPRVR